MRGHYDAVVALLRGAVPSDLPIHDTDATSAGNLAAYPYLVISGGVPARTYDAVGACATGVDGLIRVTHVALTPGAVRRLVGSTRLALEGQALPIPGGDEIRLEASQGVDVDRDVRLVAADSTTAYPYYAVDIYRLSTSI